MPRPLKISIPQIPPLGITYPSSCMLPAALKELLALVNVDKANPLCQDQQHKEGKGEDWQQDSTVSDEAMGRSSGDIFGDMIIKKGKNTLRVGFQNIGGFPTHTGKIKEELSRRGITKYEFDMFGCAETNVD